jgi:hypothetical protein
MCPKSLGSIVSYERSIRGCGVCCLCSSRWTLLFTVPTSPFIVQGGPVYKGYDGKTTSCYSAATLLEQCHVVGLRLPLVQYTALVVVAFVGWHSCGSYSKVASPDPGARQSH